MSIPARPRRLMVIGAHPDDAEFHAGGLMQRWAHAGLKIMILSLTDGSAGHHELKPADLAAIRRREALAAAKRLHAQLQIWEEADGSLQPTLGLRHKLIRTIREFSPDLIVTHRPADYHPDHRAAAQLVQDACYLLQVPNIVPETPPLSAMPPVLLAWDRFTYPRPFRADWLIDTGTVLNQVVELLHCHASQVYEWLPYVQGIAVPDEYRLDWLKKFYTERPAYVAKRYSQGQMDYAEAFEISEYAGKFDLDLFNQLLNTRK